MFLFLRQIPHRNIAIHYFDEKSLFRRANFFCYLNLRYKASPFFLQKNCTCMTMIFKNAASAPKQKYPLFWLKKAYDERGGGILYIVN